MNIFRLSMENNISVAEEDMLNGVEIPLDNSVDDILDCRRRLELAKDIFTEVSNLRNQAEESNDNINVISVDTVKRLVKHVNIDIEITTESFIEKTTDALVRIYEYIKSLFKKVTDFLNRFKTTTENNLKKIYKVTKAMMDKYKDHSDIDGSVKLDNYKDKLYNTANKSISYAGIASGIKTDIEHVKNMTSVILPNIYSIGLANGNKVDISPKLLGFGGYIIKTYQDIPMTEPGGSGSISMSLQRLYPIKQGSDFVDHLPTNSDVLVMLGSVMDLCGELMLLIKETEYTQKHITEYLVSIRETSQQVVTEDMAKRMKGFQDNAEVMLKVLTITFPKFINYNLMNIKYILEVLDVERMSNRYRV